MILQRLEKGVVVGDGGAIFELERRGYVSAGPYTPQAVIERPEAVRQMQVDFARAGAQVLQACTYYAHEEKLKNVGLEGALREINANAVRIASEVASEYGALVAGNISNTWVYDPADPASHAETRRQFDEQLGYQLSDDVDFFIAETIEYLGEAMLALEAIKATGKPAMITMGFKVDDMTLDGIVLEEAFGRLQDAGAEMVGINCFRGPETMLPLAQRVCDTVSVPVATQPVAYRCTPEHPYFQILQHNGRRAFPLELDPFVLTRGEMADYAIAAKDMGVKYIGSCCGSSTHHIRAMAEALGYETPNSRYSPAIGLHPIVGDKESLKEKDERILCQQRYGKANCHFKTEDKDADQ